MIVLSKKAGEQKVDVLPDEKSLGKLHPQVPRFHVQRSCQCLREYALQPKYVKIKLHIYIYIFFSICTLDILIQIDIPTKSYWISNRNPGREKIAFGNHHVHFLGIYLRQSLADCWQSIAHYCKNSFLMTLSSNCFPTRQIAWKRRNKGWLSVYL